MSEYQFVQFMAVDKPVSTANLAFMRRQSTRADISAWQFTNEYHFGDFSGDAAEMLRRGYDVHLHYANFGVRKLMMRLPQGLPCDKRTFVSYAVEDSLTWEPDKRGRGGILTIYPEADAGTYEDCWDVDSLLPRLVPLRAALIDGDLRPLFLAWLACSYDDDAEVPPVPAGLGKLTAPLTALAEFYQIPKALIREAARHSPPAPTTVDLGVAVEQWIARQGKPALQRLVGQLLSNDSGAARADILSEIRNDQPKAAWPTSPAQKTWGQLRQAVSG